MQEKIRILVVDDEEDICNYLKTALERTSRFEVTITTDSTRVVEVAVGLKPRVIVLDIFMPGLSGSEVAEQLQKNRWTCDIPIIFLTALARKDEVAESAGMIGGNYFLSKPVTNEELIAKIDLVLR